MKAERVISGRWNKAVVCRDCGFVKNSEINKYPPDSLPDFKVTMSFIDRYSVADGWNSREPCPECEGQMAVYLTREGYLRVDAGSEVAQDE